MIDMPAKIWPHIVPRPAGQTKLAPMIVVAGLTEHVDHAIDCRRASDNFAPRIVQTPPIKPRLRFRLEQPVSARIADGEKIANRNVKPDPVVFATGLQQQHPVSGVRRKAIGQDASSRARTHNDVVELAFERCRLRHFLPSLQPEFTAVVGTCYGDRNTAHCACAAHAGTAVPINSPSYKAVPVGHRRRTAMSVRLFGLLAFLVALSGTPQPVIAQEQITVFAAASLKNALDDANAAFTKATGIKVVSSYEASSALARQIEQGAPADVFISADLRWMDYVAERKL